MSSAADLLKTLPYFSSLGSDGIERVARELLELSFARGEVMFLEGEPCRGLYVVASGQVRIYKSSAEGREQVLLVARRGDSFNDVPVFDGGTNPASASALEDTTVYVIPGETVLSLRADCPPARDILKLFAAHLRHLTTVVEGLSFRSVVGRLARFLLDTAVVEGGPSPVQRLTQDEMAARLSFITSRWNIAQASPYLVVGHALPYQFLFHGTQCSRVHVLQQGFCLFVRLR